MFYKVQILDAKGKLKKTFTSEMLSKRHWDLFSDNVNKSEKKSKTKNKKIKTRFPILFKRAVEFHMLKARGRI